MIRSYLVQRNRGQSHLVVRAHTAEEANKSVHDGHGAQPWEPLHRKEHRLAAGGTVRLGASYETFPEIARVVDEGKWLFEYRDPYADSEINALARDIFVRAIATVPPPGAFSPSDTAIARGAFDAAKAFVKVRNERAPKPVVGSEP